MNKLKISLILASFVFFAGLIWAAVAGDFALELEAVMAYPWGKFMLFDLYVGFAIFSILIAFVEKSFMKSFFWILSLCIIGNLIALIYLMLKIERIQTLMKSEN